jgi:hypothetical protein
MHIVAVAWGYVVVMMALVEAFSSNGTLLGAFFTLLLYGILPLAIVMYVMGAPMRRRARRAAESAQGSAAQPDGGGHAPTDPVTPVREER